MADTVHGRMQKNGGFATGPDHMMERVGPMLPKRVVDKANAPASQQKPPNLRDSEVAGEDCAACEYFDDGQRLCSKYDYKVAPIKVCDSFEAAGESGPETDEDEPPTAAA